MMHGVVGKAALLAGAIMLAGVCDVSAKEPAPATWHPLFEGKLLDTFRGWRSESMPEGWHVVDGTLSKEGDAWSLRFEISLELGAWDLELFHPLFLQPGPRTTCPGIAPVCSPSFNTCTPFTNTSRMPVEY